MPPLPDRLGWIPGGGQTGNFRNWISVSLRLATATATLSLCWQAAGPSEHFPVTNLGGAREGVRSKRCVSWVRRFDIRFTAVSLEFVRVLVFVPSRWRESRGFRAARAARRGRCEWAEIGGDTPPRSVSRRGDGRRVEGSTNQRFKNQEKKCLVSHQAAAGDGGPERVLSNAQENLSGLTRSWRWRLLWTRARPAHLPGGPGIGRPGAKKYSAHCPLTDVHCPVLRRRSQEQAHTE